MEGDIGVNMNPSNLSAAKVAMTGAVGVVKTGPELSLTVFGLQLTATIQAILGGTGIGAVFDLAKGNLGIEAAAGLGIDFSLDFDYISPSKSNSFNKN